MDPPSRLSCFCAVLLILLVSQAGANCPDRWFTFQSSCYLFGDSGMHFTEAEAYCRQHGGHLVEVDNVSENHFLQNEMTGRRDTDYWLGMTDETVEGRWVWFNNKFVVTYLDWSPGEPQNYKNSEDCAAFGHRLQYHWKDVPCQTDRRPLCEKTNTGSEIIVG